MEAIIFRSKSIPEETTACVGANSSGHTRPTVEKGSSMGLLPCLTTLVDPKKACGKRNSLAVVVVVVAAAAAAPARMAVAAMLTETETLTTSITTKMTGRSATGLVEEEAEGAVELLLQVIRASREAKMRKGPLKN